MVCPGSVGLSSGVQDEESDFAAEGTAAHSLGDYCLNTKSDAWEFIGTRIRGSDFWPPKSKDKVPDNAFTVDADMANAVQVYLNDCRRLPDQNQGNTFVERSFHCKKLHSLFYGKADFAYVDFKNRALHVTDYKHGAGIVVEVKDNPQLMYYGVGMLEDLDLWHLVDTVVLTVVQPRGWHHHGPIRRWSVSVLDLEKWLDDTLVPAMQYAEVSRDTKSGDHCRFCPARSRACPQLVSDMEELQKMVDLIEGKGGAKALTNAELGRFMSLFDVAKIVNKAAEKTAFTRLQAGKKVPGRKLVNKRVNRAWKDGAEKALKKKFGEKCMTEPELKSPAKIDELPGGEDLTARWAAKPVGAGMSVVSVTDSRASVGKDTKSLFKDQTKGKK